MKFVGIGCSWMYGAELLDPKIAKDGTGHDYIDNWKHYATYWHDNIPYREGNCFLGLLGDNQNLGEGGGTMRSMFFKFMNHINNNANPDNDFYIFAFTHPSRESWYSREDNEWIHSTWVQNSTPENMKHHRFKETLKEYNVHTLSPEYEKIQWTSYATAMLGTAKAKGFKYIAFNSLESPYKINDKNFFWQGHCMFEELRSRGKKYFHKGGHPNEDGHKWIAGRVKEFIDTAYPSLL